MSHILSDFHAFLQSAPTPWHAVQQLGNRLAMCDFAPLDEQEPWQLEPGYKYFVARGGALCAFILPKTSLKRAVILASHTDSPGLKLKPNACVCREGMLLLGAEVYGSPLLTSWLNRDLCLAGRVITANEQGEREKHLVILDDAPFLIPQLAYHLDRESQEKGLLLNRQEHLYPIFGLSPKQGDLSLTIENAIRRHLSFSSLLSFELFLVPLEEPRFVCHNQEMIAASRLDNLTSAHASVCALGASQPSQETLQMALFFNHEEIGSQSREGAASPFLTDLLTRISMNVKMPREDFYCFKNRSLCVSVDVAHALHPNQMGKHDPHHQPLPAKGIVIKHNAGQRYACGAVQIATIVQACQRLQLPYQSFVSRSDIPCGSTIGPIITEKTGIPTVDIGAPLFSMHSIREMMAVQDHIDMTQLLTYLLEE